MRRLVALVAILALAGCDLEPARQVRDCIRTEHYTEWVPRGTTPEFGVSIGGLKQVHRTRCAEWTPYRDNPAHAEWLDRQRNQTKH